MLVRDAFVGQTIFITGGSGFLGKVLIEKLLRYCPGIGKIYVLLRNSKGKSAEQRLEEIKQSELFLKVRNADPECLKKVVAVAGNISELKLGMNDRDWNFLAENINIIYNVAASVRFDDPLRYAILMNVRGTREVTSLALQCRNISTFAHISTTYCNTDKQVVEEKLYPPHTDWRMAIKLAEDGDPYLLQSLELKYIYPLYNTYTFAKSLSEHVVNDMCTGKMNTLILRPSIVIGIIEDPIRGWLDNLNGPVGMSAAGAKGLLRTMWAKGDIEQNYIPVDVVIRIILVATKKKLVDGDKKELDVYNCSQDGPRLYTMSEYVDMGRKVVWSAPVGRMLWYPRFSAATCWYSYYLQVIVSHMLPALLLDMVLKMARQKTMFIKIQRKIYIANTILQPFLANKWKFLNDKSIALDETIDPEDREYFSVSKFIDLTYDEMFDFVREQLVGIVKYVFKEEVPIEKSQHQIYRYWLLDMVVRLILFSFLVWTIFIRMNLLDSIYNNVSSYITFFSE